jgi:hypothetical protein
VVQIKCLDAGNSRQAIPCQTPSLKEPAQTLQASNPGIADLCVLNLEYLEGRQPLQVHETGVADLRVAQGKLPERGQTLDTVP